MSTGNRRHPQVVNLEEVDGRQTEKGARFGACIKPLGANAGAHALGCNWFEVEPGRTAFPHHFHCGIEEALFVLEGEGELRIKDERVRVRAGDFVSFPPGPDSAHQLVNTGAGSLRYLCLSNKAHADVVGYPDSKKVACMASSSFNFFDPPWVRSIFNEGDTVDYYAGEDTD